MRLLLVEDDAALAAALQPALLAEGYAVDAAPTGPDGLAMLAEGVYDVCVLDRMLPGLDGLTVLRAARARGVTTPVLLLTALDRVGDRVDGLDAGADDYLTKPFDNRELLARLRALCRRPAAAGPDDACQCGDLCLLPGQLTLRGPAGQVTLTRRECALLETLCKNAGSLQSRAVLLGRVWGPLAEVEEANLDCYVHFVRRRLAAVGSRARVVTVRGAGYRLEIAP